MDDGSFIVDPFQYNAMNMDLDHLKKLVTGLTDEEIKAASPGPKRDFITFLRMMYEGGGEEGDKK